MEIPWLISATNKIGRIERQKLPTVLANKLNGIEHKIDFLLLEEEREIESGESRLEKLGLGGVVRNRQVVLVYGVVFDENLLVGIE